MRRAIALALAAGACGKVSAMPDGAAPDASTADAADRVALIRKAIDAAVAGPMAQPGAVGMVVGVIDGDDRVLAYYGVSTLGTGAAPNATTLFEIGSNSKTFTATLLAYDVQQHAVALDDTLDQYLPAQYQFASGDPKLAITLAQLAEHTAGLPRNPTDVAAGATSYTIDQMLADTDGLALASTPGTKFVYSNLGYALLGDALANHAGQTWEVRVQQILCAPLGMTDTDVYTSLGPAQRARAATGYAAAPVGTCTTPPCAVSPSLILANFPQPAVNPGGGLYASPTDMMTWLAYNMDLSSTTAGALAALPAVVRQKRFQTSADTWVGLAWNTTPIMLGDAASDEIWKDGDTNGFHSFIGYVPDAHTGVFVLANFGSTPVPNALGDQILAQLP